MPIVKMPDGTLVRFSDDTPKEQIRAVIDSKFPDYWRTLDAKAGYAEREAARQKEFDANKSPLDHIAEGVVNAGNTKTGRTALSAMQGINESIVNPVGLAQRTGNAVMGDGFNIGKSMKPITPETPLEKASYLAAQMGAEAPVYAAGLGAAKAAGVFGQGASKLSRGLRAIATPSAMPLEIAGGAGSGAALGAVEPESGLGKFAVGMAGGITGAGAMGQVLKGINRAAVGLGKRNFVKQLERGTDFKDVGFGRLSQNKLDSLNGLRDLEGVVKLDNGKLSIPAPVVRHFHERRIAGNGYTPQQVADLLDKAIHGKNSVVSRAAYPQIQALVDTQSVPANVGYIGKHTDTGATIVKGGHKIENSRLGRYKDLAPQGEQKPSLRVDTFVSPENNIPQSLGFVNENFIKGLADKDKARVLKNAGMAGDDNILAEARALTDRITRLEAGAPDTALANAMLTPQMKAAKTEYGAYMARNGDLPVDSKFIRQWRKENKTAKRFIDNYYRTHPKGFAGIPDGTLQELEEVKQILKNGANRLGEDTAKKGAFDAARNQIKDYMENQVAGFRPMNARYADAKMTQRMFEDAVKRGASQVGRSTVSQFKDQLIMTLGGGGALGGALTANPVTLASGLSALGLRELIRAGRRRAGRQIMENGARTTLADMLLNGAKAIPAGVPSTTLVKMLQEKLRAD